MTYEYACDACGHQWEAEQSIKEAPLKTCVACGKETAKRLVSGGTGFLLKGGGWYADGYGSKSSSTSDAPAAKSSPATSSSDSSSSSTKTESGAKSSATSESTATKSEPAKAASSPST